MRSRRVRRRSRTGLAAAERGRSDLADAQEPSRQDHREARATPRAASSIRHRRARRDIVEAAKADGETEKRAPARRGARRDRRRDQPRARRAARPGREDRRRRRREGAGPRDRRERASRSARPARERAIGERWLIRAPSPGRTLARYSISRTRARASSSGREALNLAAAVLNDPGAKRALARPDLQQSQRIELVHAVVQGLGGGELWSSSEGRNLLALLVENDRLTAVPEIAAQFDALKTAAENRVKATLVSAVPVDKSVADQVGSCAAEKARPQRRAHARDRSEDPRRRDHPRRGHGHRRFRAGPAATARRVPGR